MDRNRFYEFIGKNFSVTFPELTYKNFTKYRVNSEIGYEGPYPVINNATKFIVGLHTGEWICFGLSQFHYQEKENRKGEDEWIEGENHVFSEADGNPSFRYIFLRNGGNFEQMLHILGNKLDLLREFWDVGIAIKTQQRGVAIVDYFFDIHPTVGDLFLISLCNPEMLPLLDIKSDLAPEIVEDAKTMLADKVASIILPGVLSKPVKKQQNESEDFQQSTIRKSKLITKEVAQKVGNFIVERHTHVLTIMFTDLVGSTAINDKLGEAEASKLRKTHDEIINKVINMKKDGKVVKTIGDSFMVVFSKPSVAVSTALNIQKALYLYNNKKTINYTPLNVRIGINMGEVSVESSKGWDIFGQHVNIASRVEALAGSGQILTTSTVYESSKSWLTGDSQKGLEWENYGEYSLKGIREPVSIFEIYDSEWNQPKTPAKPDKTNDLVLLVDDEDIYLSKYRALLEKNFDVILAKDGEAGLEKIKKHKPAVIVTDLLMPPGEWGGIFLIEKAKEISPQSKIIVLSSSGHLKMAVETIKKGAFDYIEKISEDETLTQIVFEAMRP